MSQSTNPAEPRAHEISWSKLKKYGSSLLPNARRAELSLNRRDDGRGHAISFEIFSPLGVSIFDFRLGKKSLPLLMQVLETVNDRSFTQGLRFVGSLTLSDTKLVEFEVERLPNLAIRMSIKRPKKTGAHVFEGPFCLKFIQAIRDLDRACGGVAS